MKPVLCIRNQSVDSLGIVPGALAEEGLEVAVLDAFAEPRSWPTPSDVAGMVLSGGEMNVDLTDRYPYLGRERALVRQALGAGVPILGICLGAEMLARALDVPVVPSPVREFGFYPLELTPEGRDDPLLGAFDGDATVFLWHEDTHELPPGGTLLATAPTVPVQAFRVANAWGMQFHCEITAPELDEWLAAAGPSVKEDWGRSPAEIRRQVAEHLHQQQKRGRDLLAGFADIVRSTPGG